jgi:hypothetical protein
MLSSGKRSLRKQPTKTAYFFLDECLAHQIGDFLHVLGYPIVSWYEAFRGQQGYKDTPLIQYLGGKGYTWITKDDAAKSEHEKDIRSAGISVVWIRGLEREKSKPRKNKITNKHIHRMLTDKLDSITDQISHSKTALYFLLSVKTGYNGELIPVIRPISLDYFFNQVLPQINQP